jgi:hypothetical protein
MEIDLQYACLGSLAVYSLEGGQLGWVPSDFVERVEAVDPKRIEFTLKPGIMWSDDFGELTAEDVQYSYERIANPKNEAPWKDKYKPLDRVEVTGKYSGALVLKNPFSPLFVTTLCDGPGPPAAFKRFPIGHSIGGSDWALGGYGGCGSAWAGRAGSRRRVLRLTKGKAHVTKRRTRGRRVRMPTPSRSSETSLRQRNLTPSREVSTGPRSPPPRITVEAPSRLRQAPAGSALLYHKWPSSRPWRYTWS